MPNKMPIIVSHYTKNTGYEQEIKKLVASLIQFGLEYDIEAIDSFGSWRKNSNYCARNVQRALAQYPDRDILRVDADAVFQRSPELFLQDDFVADIAAHVHDFPWHQHELLGGTIFFRNKPNVRWLVDCWTVECMVNRPTLRNPDLLQEIIQHDNFHVTFAELPPQYTTIFDIMRDVKDPVVVHYQASRRFRRQVNVMGVR